MCIRDRPDLDLEYGKSIKRYERKYQKAFGFSARMKLQINHYMPFLSTLRGIIKNSRIKPLVDNDILYNEFLKYYESLDKFKSVFALDNVRLHINKFGGKYNRLTTIAIYLSEIEKRYSNKIKIKN